jgi:AraC-like DNA-binding protein
LYIENHYSSVITLDEIASQFGFSAAYFSRYFKKHTGSNFLDYLTDYRLEKAAKTIIRTKLTGDFVKRYHARIMIFNIQQYIKNTIIRMLIDCPTD